MTISLQDISNYGSNLKYRFWFWKHFPFILQTLFWAFFKLVMHWVAQTWPFFYKLGILASCNNLRIRHDSELWVSFCNIIKVKSQSLSWNSQNRVFRLFLKTSLAMGSPAIWLSQRDYCVERPCQRLLISYSIWVALLIPKW